MSSNPTASTYSSPPLIVSNETSEPSPTTNPAASLTGITTLRNQVYASIGSRDLLLDLYFPEDVPASVPLIIWIHGGGWQSGSKENPLPVRLGFVEKGYAVASINYRLSGEAVFPAQIEDCKAAVRWLRANAVKYGLDPEHFGAWGSSAGGHLAGLLGTSGGVVELEGSVGGNLEYSSRVQAVCDYYGPADLTRLLVTVPGLPGAAGGAVSKLLGALDQSKARAASPLTYISRDDPPFFIVHGDADHTVPVSQSQILYDALRQGGVEASIKIIKGAGHGGAEFSSIDMAAQVASFFDPHLR